MLIAYDSRTKLSISSKDVGITRAALSLVLFDSLLLVTYYEHHCLNERAQNACPIFMLLFGKHDGKHVQLIIGDNTCSFPQSQLQMLVIRLLYFHDRNKTSSVVPVASVISTSSPLPLSHHFYDKYFSNNKS